MNNHPDSLFAHQKKAFTLVELLVVIAVISVLMSILMPALGRVKQQAKSVSCLSNLRQIGFAFVCYAVDNDDFCMPNYETTTDTYWWGAKKADGIDHEKGFTWPYLKSELKKNSVYECASQKLGTYKLQGKPLNEPDDPKWITSTYGYNGYYLCPPKSPWMNISHRPWKKTSNVPQPSKVIAFADSMLDWDTSTDGQLLQNSALIDPPYILSASGKSWQKNPCPTTCFRHNEKANIFFVDGHSTPVEIEDGSYTSPTAKIGSVTQNNSPYYVPDYEQWIQSSRRHAR